MKSSPMPGQPRCTLDSLPSAGAGSPFISPIPSPGSHCSRICPLVVQQVCAGCLSFGQWRQVVSEACLVPDSMDLLTTWPREQTWEGDMIDKQRVIRAG